MSSEPVQRDMPAFVANLLPFLSELRDAIVVFDSKGQWIYGNPSFTGLVRFDPDSGADLPWIPRQSADRWRYFFELHRSGRATELGVGPVQVDLMSGDGTLQTVSVSWDRVVDNDRTVVAMLALVRPLPAGGQSSDRDLTSLLAELTVVVGRLTAKAAQGREQSNGNGQGNGHSGSAVNGSTNGSTHAELSPRELEILASTLAGRRISTTARELYLSEHTVRNHLKRIYRKMGVHSLGELRERHTPATA